MNTNSVRIEALGHDNYDTWKIQMKALLIKNDAWGYVCGRVVKPELVQDNAAAIEEWTNRDEKARSDLILSISSNQLKLIKNCATSRELWQKLEDTFQSRGPARKATLLKNLTLKKMGEGGDIHEHLREFFDSVDKLSEMDVNINDDQLAIMLLYSLPASYENFRVAIESRDELPTPDNLRTKITEEYDARRNTATSNSSQGAMFVHQRRKWENKKGKTCGEKEDKKEKQSKFKCFKCHKQGHKQADCPLRKVNENSSANVALLSTEVNVDSCQNVSTTHSTWCLDSGCTSHLCRDLSLFTKVYSNQSGQVKLASEASAEIKGKGTAAIKTEVNGEKCDVKVHDTLHVPDLRTNLLSVPKITDNGYQVLFDKRQAEILD